MNKLSLRHAVLAGAILLANGAQAAGFKLSSPDFKAGGVIAKNFEFNGFGCSGDNKSPVLKWSGAPKTAKSFAVMVHDPDAPTGGAGWWHWVVINIPADVSELKSDAGNASGANLPAGARQVRTDFGTAAWGGMCPPQGDKPHRYNFTVYALKVDKLDIPADATAALAGYMINANSLGKASLTGKYGRPKAK